MFQNGIFEVLRWFYLFAHDWGLAIILITILFRILVYPITAKQFKSTYAMQKLQPKIKEINEKYADDPQKKQAETMKVYSEAKFNPLSGCLPMLLQMPIFIALYWVLRDMGSKYIPEHVAAGTLSADALPATFYGLVPDLTMGPSTIFAESGITLAIVPYVLLVLLFSSSMLLPLLMNKNVERQTLIMTGVMAVMMLWFGWGAPAGVLLYWDMSSLLGAAQQFLSRKLMERKDEEQEAIEIKPVKVEVERKERKKPPAKKK
jgi:YidC/Oxa1 family membrane protein insertase